MKQNQKSIDTGHVANLGPEPEDSHKIFVIPATGQFVIYKDDEGVEDPDSRIWSADTLDGVVSYAEGVFKRKEKESKRKIKVKCLAVYNHPRRIKECTVTGLHGGNGTVNATGLGRSTRWDKPNGFIPMTDNGVSPSVDADFVKELFDKRTKVQELLHEIDKTLEAGMVGYDQGPIYGDEDLVASMKAFEKDLVEAAKTMERLAFMRVELTVPFLPKKEAL